MLPFLKAKQVAGVILTKRKADGQSEIEGMEGDENQALSSAAADLIRAVHAKDEAAVAAAMRAGFEILQSEEQQQEPSESEIPSEGQE